MTGESLIILIFGITLLIMFIGFIYSIEKSDKETQKYIDKHFDKVGNWLIRKK